MDTCKPKQNYPTSHSPLQKSQSCSDRKASSWFYNPLHPSQPCLYDSLSRKESQSAVYTSSRSNRGFFMEVSESDCVKPSRAGLLFGFRRADDSSRVLIFYTARDCLWKCQNAFLAFQLPAFFFPFTFQTYLPKELIERYTTERNMTS